MKVSMEEFAEVIMAAVIVILFVVLLNKTILVALQQPTLIKNIFEALLGASKGS